MKMNDIETQNFDPNDLDWLAFCYVADELDDAQTAEFEIRLESDQAARDAVVAAMHSATAIDRALATSVASNTQNQLPEKRRTSFWFQPAPLLAAVVALMLLVALINFDFKSNDGGVASQGDLAEAWASSFSEESELAEEVVTLVDYTSFDAEAEEDNSWLLAALIDPDEVNDDPEGSSFNEELEDVLPCME